MKKLMAKIYWSIMSTIAVMVVTPIWVVLTTGFELWLVWETISMGITAHCWTFDFIVDGTVVMYEEFTKDAIGLYKDGFEMIDSGDLA